MLQPARGEIPPDLGDLRYLKVLDLSGNRLTGVIPSELGNLTKLIQLRLGDNRLVGCVPRELREAEADRDVVFCDYDQPASEETATGTEPDNGGTTMRREIRHSPELLAACSNGVAVPNPEDNPGLVNDCAALLAARTH